MKDMGCVMVTGALGFIGCHLIKDLLERGLSLVCIDNFNPYYDNSLKRARKEDITSTPPKQKPSGKVWTGLEHRVELFPAEEPVPQLDPSASDR